MSVERVVNSEEEMWEVLSQEGVRKIPNRSLVVPTPNPSRIKWLVGEKDQKEVESSLQLLESFLYWPIIVDNFGNDNAARDRWRDHHEKRYGSLFHQVFEEKNKIRVNYLSGVGIFIYGFTIKVRKQGHIWESRILDNIREEMFSKLSGKRTRIKYRNFPDLDSKLEVLNFFEDCLIDTLLFFSGDVPSEEGSGDRDSYGSFTHSTSNSLKAFL